MRQECLTGGYKYSLYYNTIVATICILHVHTLDESQKDFHPAVPVG